MDKRTQKMFDDSKEMYDSIVTNGLTETIYIEPIFETELSYILELKSRIKKQLQLAHEQNELLHNILDEIKRV